jgi:hypothetical protein
VLLIAPVLLGIVLALLRGGALRHLAALPFRGAGLIVLSLAIQVVIYFPVLRSSMLARQDGPAIYIGALALVLFGVARNWQLGPALRIVLLGLALNAVVIVANGGHMPVNAAAMRSVQGSARVSTIAAHQSYTNTRLANRSSRLLVLSDIFPVPLPFGHGNVYSLGDALIVGGGTILVFSATRRPWRQEAVTPGQAVILPPAA